MKIFFYTLNDSGSGIVRCSKEEAIKEFTLMLEDFEANGGTDCEITLDGNASFFLS